MHTVHTVVGTLYFLSQILHGHCPTNEGKVMGVPSSCDIFCAVTVGTFDTIVLKPKSSFGMLTFLDSSSISSRSSEPTIETVLDADGTLNLATVNDCAAYAGYNFADAALYLSRSYVDFTQKFARMRDVITLRLAHELAAWAALNRTWLRSLSSSPSRPRPPALVLDSVSGPINIQNAAKYPAHPSAHAVAHFLRHKGNWALAAVTLSAAIHLLVWWATLRSTLADSWHSTGFCSTTSLAALGIADFAPPILTVAHKTPASAQSSELDLTGSTPERNTAGLEHLPGRRCTDTALLDPRVAAPLPLADMGDPLAPLPPPPDASDPPPDSDLSALSDDELERQIRELTLEIEMRDARIGVLEGYIAQLDAHDAALARLESRLARVDDCTEREGADEEDRDRWRKMGCRPWPVGSAGH